MRYDPHVRNNFLYLILILGTPKGCPTLDQFICYLLKTLSNQHTNKLKQIQNCAKIVMLSSPPNQEPYIRDLESLGPALQLSAHFDEFGKITFDNEPDQIASWEHIMKTEINEESEVSPNIPDELQRILDEVDLGLDGQVASPNVTLKSDT